MINSLSGATEDRLIYTAGKEILFDPFSSRSLEGKRCVFLGGGGGAPSQNCEKIIGFIMSVCPHVTVRFSIGRILMKFDI